MNYFGIIQNSVMSMMEYIFTFVALKGRFEYYWRHKGYSTVF
jgi:hypothetical protein